MSQELQVVSSCGKSSKWQLAVALALGAKHIDVVGINSAFLGCQIPLGLETSCVILIIIYGDVAWSPGVRLFHTWRLCVAGYVVPLNGLWRAWPLHGCEGDLCPKHTQTTCSVKDWCLLHGISVGRSCVLAVSKLQTYSLRWESLNRMKLILPPTVG